MLELPREQMQLLLVVEKTTTDAIVIVNQVTFYCKKKKNIKACHLHNLVHNLDNLVYRQMQSSNYLVYCQMQS